MWCDAKNQRSSKLIAVFLLTDRPLLTLFEALIVAKRGDIC